MYLVLYHIFINYIISLFPCHEITFKIMIFLMFFFLIIETIYYKFLHFSQGNTTIYFDKTKMLLLLLSCTLNLQLGIRALVWISKK